MGASVTSAATNIKNLDDCAYQVNFTGTPTGAFTVEVSLDYAQDFMGNITNAGTWNTMVITGTFAPAGSAGSFYIPLPVTNAAPYVRLVYTRTSGTGTLNAFFSGKML